MTNEVIKKRIDYLIENNLIGVHTKSDRVQIGEEYASLAGKYCETIAKIKDKEVGLSNTRQDHINCHFELANLVLTGYLIVSGYEFDDAILEIKQRISQYLDL